MREIKFRAWCSRHKVMITNIINISFCSKGFYVNGDSPCMGDEILMQYTGFKDKNGKEIYEGDILKRDGHWNMYIVWDDEYSRLAFICADWIVTQGKTIMLSQESLRRHAVVGNIYENPELIDE